MLPPQLFSVQAVLSFASACIFFWRDQACFACGGSASLFAEADVSRQLSDIQSSSSLRSQQSLVAISSHSSAARSGLLLPVVLLLGGIRLATVAVILVLCLVAFALIASSLFLLTLL